jgi:chromosome segregation ATPase
MFYSLPLLFLIFLVVGEAAFCCGPAFRVSSFVDTVGRVHSIKKTTSVFYGKSDDVSERDKKILKALEKKDAENLDLRFAQVMTKIDTTTEALKKEINTVNAKIDTTAEALKKDIDALNTKIDTNTEALKKDIDSLNAKIDRNTEALNAKIDTNTEALNTKIDTNTKALNSKMDTNTEALTTTIDTTTEGLATKLDKQYVVLIVIFCLTLFNQFPSVIAALRKH